MNYLLAEFSDSIEKLLTTQTGFSLGLLVGVALSFLAQKWWLVKYFDKMDLLQAANNRLARVISASLMDSQIAGIKQIGMDVTSEINAEEARK